MTPTSPSKWKIWFRRLNDQGKMIGGGVLPFAYTYKADAMRRAKKHFGDNPKFTWCVSQTNPATTGNQ